MNYPVYQQPMMVPPMGYPMYQGGFQPNMMGMNNIPGMTGGISSNTFEQQINNLEQQIKATKDHIHQLETMLTTAKNHLQTLEARANSKPVETITNEERRIWKQNK